MFAAAPGARRRRSFAEGGDGGAGPARKLSAAGSDTGHAAVPIPRKSRFVGIIEMGEPTPRWADRQNPSRIPQAATLPGRRARAVPTLGPGAGRLRLGIGTESGGRRSAVAGAPTEGEAPPRGRGSQAAGPAQAGSAIDVPRGRSQTAPVRPRLGLTGWSNSQLARRAAPAGPARAPRQLCDDPLCQKGPLLLLLREVNPWPLVAPAAASCAYIVVGKKEGLARLKASLISRASRESSIQIRSITEKPGKRESATRTHVSSYSHSDECSR